MFRTALRTASRPAAAGLRSSAATSRCASAASRRWASSSAEKPRSWKSSGLRWGLAGGAVYFYLTSPYFAEETKPQTVAAPEALPKSDLPTVDSVLDEKRKQTPKPDSKPVEKPTTEETPKSAESSAAAEPASSDAESAAAAPAGSPAALEEEAGQQGAFNPETGEINWDCPCLGGMADGPCGEEFKTAFSCFVYSTEEPKGMDCIEKFQGMQECFKKYPEIYGAELADDDEDGEPATPDFGEPDGQTQHTDPAPPASEKSASASRSAALEDEVQPAETRVFDATKANDAVTKQ